MQGFNTMHNKMASCFNPASLPLITDAWVATTVLDEVVEFKNYVGNGANVNAIMIELKVDGWVVFDETIAYPVFADVPLKLDFKNLSKIKIVGAIGTKYRFIIMSY